MKSIRDIQEAVHNLAREKGWWPTIDRNSVVNGVPEKLALIHSEVSEALEEHRSGKPHVDFYYCDPVAGCVCATPTDKCKKPEGFGVELADTVIRIMDLCGALGIDLELAIREKHEYNKTRPFRHGGKKC